MDHRGEALIGLVGAHGDAFELLEPSEEVLDEMPPFVHFLVDGERLCAARMLGDNDFGAARVEFCDNGVAIERLVGDQRVEGQSLDEWRHAHRIEALSRQKHEAHEIAETQKGDSKPSDRPLERRHDHQNPDAHRCGDPGCSL
jgi:hypothetical protein